MEPSPHDRLCSWLGLPPGSWPPDHYALLDLTRGAGDISDIEERVLARMEHLRPHQLLHPDLVTEGMNRLAQALVCLTDPVARAAYDRSLGIAPPPFEVVEDEPGEEPAEVPFEPGLRPPGEAQPPAFEVVEDEPEPLPLPYEVVYYEVVEDEPKEPAPVYEVFPVGETRKSEAEPNEWAEVAQTADQPPPPSPVPAQPNRRTIYRRLASVRKAIRAWEGLRPVFGTPTESLATPVAVLLFVQALAAAREALPGVKRLIHKPGSPGGIVAALVRLPHVLHTLRTLLPSQRQAVARDWQRGHESLRRAQTQLREMATLAKPRRWTNELLRPFRAIRRTPEWVLLIAAALALALAVLRRNS